MKILLILVAVIGLGHQTFGQDVIINGVNKHRLLVWEDFTGKPDKRSEHEANTYWNINFGYQGVRFTNDTAKFTGLNVTLELNNSLSWIKNSKATPYLLKHEQGHFDLGVMCQKEILLQINMAVFLRSDYQKKIQTLFNTTLEKYRILGSRYDEETEHSKFVENQQKWNSFFADALKN